MKNILQMKSLSLCGIWNSIISKKVIKVYPIKEAQGQHDRTMFFSAPTDKKIKAQYKLNNNKAKGQHERMMLLNAITARKRHKA
jgi:hypothetical protein